MTEIKIVMTKAQATQAWLGGQLILPCTYVGSTAENISWRDKSNGKAMTAPVLKHNIILGRRVALVNERVAENFDVNSYKETMPPMSQCILTIESMEVTKGVPSFRGKLEPLTA